MSNSPIGIFDSGKGGLTVLEQVKKQLPKENVIYYGDVARVPFGGKAPEEIIKINLEIISYLVERGVKMVIIACNTSSSLAIDEDKHKFKIPIVGLINPGAQGAVNVTKNKKVGVIATQGTVNSHSYKKNIKSIDEGVEVLEVACPKFVPLVEADKVDGPEAESAVREYLKPLKDMGIDTLIHGCTHYPFLEKDMRKFIGDINFVDPAVNTVKEAKKMLAEKQMLADNDGPNYEYVISEDQGGKYVRVDGREYLFSSTPAYRK